MPAAVRLETAAPASTKVMVPPPCPKPNVRAHAASAPTKPNSGPPTPAINVTPK